jgi:hypothetical protein
MSGVSLLHGVSRLLNSISDNNSTSNNDSNSTIVREGSFSTFPQEGRLGGGGA